MFPQVFRLKAQYQEGFVVFSVVWGTLETVGFLWEARAGDALNTEATSRWKKLSAVLTFH